MKTNTIDNKLNPEVESLFTRLFPCPSAKPQKDWDQVFRQFDQGFSGADGDSSLLLDNRRSLWLFGDTLVGPRNENSLKSMPRNSVGILHLNRKEFRFKFYWGERQGLPYDFFPPARPGEWLWPGTGCSVNGKLFFYLHRFQTDRKKKIESFRFRYVGFHSLCTENPMDNPDQWRLQSVVTPKLAHAVYWGLACYSSPDGYVYLWGGAGGNRKPGTVVARCAFELIGRDRENCWEYYCEGSPGPAWNREGRFLRPLFPDRSPEMSLSYLKKQNAFVAVYGLDKTHRIAIRVARQIMGPWSQRHIVYHPPDSKWHKRYFSYAPKAHPELNPKNDELLITYITNAYEANHVLKDHRIYYPRFVSLPLGE